MFEGFIQLKIKIFEPTPKKLYPSRINSYENMIPSFGSIYQLQVMDFPAQLDVLPQEQPSKMLGRDEQLTLMIRTKYDLLKSKPAIKFNMLKNYASTKIEAYNESLTEFKALLASMQEGETPDLTKFLPLIFGALEGSSSLQDELKVLAKRFGANIEKIQIDQIIRGKIRNVNYGSDKRKETNIRQVSNKQAFDSIGEYFDIKQIKAHRKMCNSIKAYLKALKKFKQCMQNSEDNQIFNEESQQNIAYIEFANEEISFNKLKIPPEILGIQSQAMIQQKEEDENNATPIKGEIVIINQKEDTASGKKNEDSENKSNKQIQEQKLKQVKDNDQESKQTRKRRTKQEILRDQEQKQKEKQQKALEQKLQQKKKEEEKILKQQEKERQRLAKEKQKQLQKQMKQKEKQRERQAKQKQKEAQRLAKQAAKEAERKAKEAAKQAERLAKQKKNNPGQSLSKWFKPAEQATPMKNEREQKIEVESTDALEDEKKQFIASINSNKIPISQLRSRFTTQKMKDQTCFFEPYYATVYIHKSRLEFDRFLINQERFRAYIQPHQEYENAKYDDSSVEFEDFCGDFCDQKMDQMSVEDEEASFNSAIVPDTYISEDEISSLNESKNQVNIKIDQGAEWSFSGINNYTADRYTMFCCYEEDALPMPLNEPEQSNNELTLNLKYQLYKEIHGYYGAKDVLIKRLAAISEKVPKSYLDTLIKETTTKRGNQRLVKPEIIDFLCEQRENFAIELQEIKKKRDEDNMIQMRGKMNEKQRQIERLILEEAGTYYIIDLLHFLREKGYRMLKRDLIQFINARAGSEWDDVRRRMSKMQLKEKQKINNFLSKKQRQAKDKRENKEENKQEKQEEKQSVEKIEKKEGEDGSNNEDKSDQNNKEGSMQAQN